MHCVVHFIALWTLNRFTYIAAEIYIWLEKIRIYSRCLQ